MTSAILEKVYMRYIIDNPTLFAVVEPFFFRNDEVRFVYKCVKDEYVRRPDRSVPTMQEIVELVKERDTDNAFSLELLKSVLKVDKDKYTNQFVEPRIDAWMNASKMQASLLESIEVMRELAETTELEKQNALLDRLRDELKESIKRPYVGSDLGVDFDDPSAHDQDTAHNKVPTQWQTLNRLMGGGFDVKTLNVLMGETNIGKSVWMHNIASGVADCGYNVLIVTLEMSEKKVIKRVGSMRLGIPVSDYDEVSRDRDYMQRMIEEHRSRTTNTNSLFEGGTGKVYVKEFPATSLTISSLEAYIKKLEDVTGNKINMVLVDYIGIMGVEKSEKIDGNLYQKGKHLAEGLRSIAQKMDLIMVTATQLSREKFGANDINLNDMPESKAIAETADTVFAIIRTPAMKMKHIYHLKALKLRDNEFAFDRMSFDFNSTYLTIHNDSVYESAA